MKLLIGVSGASGCLYSIRLLEELKKRNIETHLIVSDEGKKILEYETDLDYEEFKNMASFSYQNDDLFSPPASGSFQHNGMILAPCSMKTLSSIANGYCKNLISRTAFCTLKEERKLVLMPRETPLDMISIKNMLSAKKAGATILPACPGFYHKPNEINDLIDFIIGKILDQFKIQHSLFKRWG
ncbi:MAG: UbiX family flavin prenyltransferase [Candidatus Thermoplasmatota archaeon]